MSRENARRHAREANDVLETCRREGRNPTAAERSYVQDLLDRAKSEARHPLDAALSFNTLNDPSSGWANSGYGQASPGEMFTKSSGYKAVKNGRRGETWTTRAVDVGLSAKGTLLEGVGSPGSGTGGGWLPVPQVVPGVVDKLFQPLTVENLIMAGQATGNTVRYAVEGTATSAAAGVAEGGTKPESTLAYSTLDEPIKKIATTLTISDELLEDAPAIQSFINGRLSLFVNIEVERQLLRGTSGGNEVQGLLTSRGVPVYAGGTAAGNRAVQLFKAMNGMRGSAFVEPDWTIMNPTDWEAIRLLTDSAGQYLGGGPFLGAYGNTTQVGTNGQVSGAQDTLWNKPVYVSAALGAGTALIGTYAGAQVWSKGGASVEASNSHASYFTTDLVALRCERRLGLTLLRPGGYVEVRLA